MDVQSALHTARAHARAGRFPELLTACRQFVEAHGDDVNALLDAGALLLDVGFLSQAQACFERAQTLAPHDLRAGVNLANVAREAGNHAESRQRYAALLQQLPNNPVVRRNALIGLEYDPTATAAERLAQARSWGDWATARAGGSQPRPPLQPLHGRPLRIGYLSADFCHHTVGLFVKDVLKAHNPEQVTVFAYHVGSVNDWVTNRIRTCACFRDVTQLDDTALAALIRQDAIDLLVDLSGHTAGSRLTVFAHRPAPVQVSWLGYFATTGLPTMDFVLTDTWHMTDGAETCFTEQLTHLPHSRFCYQPPPWAVPEVTPLPCLTTGRITFGCFNNSAKLNADVLGLWAQILAAVPESRLVLKWRTFNDTALRQSVTDFFARQGIAPQRIELRGPSFHAAVLKEYADIDIALDPFPFTGGLTSCEALWMGVPVVTWPQSRMVSRQTLSLLGVIGLPELAATDAGEYVRIAVELAGNPGQLAALRSGMRARMLTSPLMDLPGFTSRLEQHLTGLYQIVCDREKEPLMSLKTILHIGPGHRNNGARLPAAFQASEWQELRLDIDPVNKPDIVGSMLDMTAVASETVDAIYSSNNIEHVYAHEVPVVLREFLRVLKPEGFAVITCPDLQAVARIITEDRLMEAAYQSPAGPISPHDILYGHGAALAAGHQYMAHKCGFTLKSLTAAVQAAGFRTIAGTCRAHGLDIWVVASKSPLADSDIRTLAGLFFPG